MLEAIDSIVGQSALLRQVMGLPEKEDDYYDELSKYRFVNCYFSIEVTQFII